MLKTLYAFSAVLMIPACAAKKSKTAPAAPAQDETPADAAPPSPDNNLPFDNNLVLSIDRLYSSAAHPATAMPGLCVSLVLYHDGPLTDAAPDAPVALSSSSASGAFYADDACSKSIKTIAVQTTSASDTVNSVFYYKDTTAGDFTLTATDNSSLHMTAASQHLVIAAPAKLSLYAVKEGQAATQKVQACTAYHVISETDSAGPVALAADTDLTLTSTATTGTFYSNATCTQAITLVTIDKGMSGVDPGFYYRDTATGTPTLTATAAAPLTALKPGTSAVTVTP